MAEGRQTLDGGIELLGWVVADEIRSFVSAKRGELTVIELRDPSRLAQSTTLFLEGPAGSLAQVKPGRRVLLRVDALRPGRGRGELTAVVEREAVESAFAGAAS
jgi:hypothetical protein